MTLRHLKIFVAVCDCGSVTRAGELLHFAQPTVSHAIAEMERYYNITLFDRINQRMVLTDDGREVLSKAREIINGFEDFEAIITYGSRNPRVRIGCSLTLGQTVIPAFLRRLKEEHPTVEPHVVIRPSAALESELECGNLDFALIEGEITSPHLRVEPFRHDRLLAVTFHDFDVPDRLTPAQLSLYPWLLRERGSASRDLFERMLAKEHLHVEPLMTSTNNQAIIAALYASLGIALLPESFVTGHIERGKFRELHIEGFDGKRTSFLVIHKNKRLNSIGSEAYEVLKHM